MCIQNLNKKCLKLDSRPILYAYNLLGYGESLSEKSGKSQKILKKNENVEFFHIVQKVFPRIPGGCMHKESDENRV